MPSSALISSLIFVLLSTLQCQFSSAQLGLQEESTKNSNAAVLLLYQIIGDLHEIKSENKKLTEKVEILEEKLELRSDPAAHGRKSSIYVRWGRPDCPRNGTELVYRGFTSGRHHIKGGGTTFLCLPDEPTWARYMDGSDSYRGNIWGAEIDMNAASEGKVFDKPIDGLDLPCAVCTAPRTISHMFPGRATCFPGWSLEYTGYLMTNYRDRAHNNEYICTDTSPVGIHGGAGSDHENVLYLVEARCGSLPCPPYVEGREVACAVCSK